MLKKPVKPRVTVRYLPQTNSVGAAIEDAYNTFQELRDEMEDWRSNMEEKFSSTEKYSLVEDCASSLDAFADNDTNIPSCIADELIQYSYGKKVSKKSPYPRHLRLSNAQAALEGALEAIDVMIDQKTLEKNLDGKTEDEIDTLNTELSELEDLKNTLEEDKDAADGIEFPGMFG